MKIDRLENFFKSVKVVTLNEYLYSPLDMGIRSEDGNVLHVGLVTQDEYNSKKTDILNRIDALYVTPEIGKYVNRDALSDYIDYVVCIEIPTVTKETKENLSKNMDVNPFYDYGLTNTIVHLIEAVETPEEEVDYCETCPHTMDCDDCIYNPDNQ